MKQDHFDHTGISAAINKTITELGETLHDFYNSTLPIARSDMQLNINLAVTILTLEISDTQHAIEKVARDVAGWAPSVSLNVAVAAAERYLAALRELPDECAADSDTDFAGAIRDLAVEMFTRDHAQDVYRLLTEGQG